MRAQWLETSYAGSDAAESARWPHGPVPKEEDSSVGERVVTRRTMLHVAMLHLGGLTVADTAARAEEGHTTRACAIRARASKL